MRGGRLPGELHKLWQAGAPGSYHLEYGYSCMGYEIAGGLGVKLARPEAEVVVMVGDGSYLMANSELASAVMLGAKLTVVVLDNRGYGCINRLQMATGGANFNNLLADTRHEVLPEIDFRAHAAALGASARKVGSIGELETALAEARRAPGTTVVGHRHRSAAGDGGRRRVVGRGGAGGERAGGGAAGARRLRGRAQAAAGGMMAGGAGTAT